jgi:hypothetical protein
MPSTEAIHADGSLTTTNDGAFTVVGEYATLRYTAISLIKAIELFDKTGMEVRKNYLKSGAIWVEQTTGQSVLTPTGRLTSAGRKRMYDLCVQIRAHIEQHTVVLTTEEGK